MAAESKIEWTDATWNPVRGCIKISPGCKNCYAETFAERWRGIKGHAYEQGFDLRLVPDKIEDPLKWKTPRRVFVNSMSDLFQDGVPDEFIDKVFAVMCLAEKHTFQILTKRHQRMREYFRNIAYRQEMIGIEAEAISGLDRFMYGGVEDDTTDEIRPRWTLPFKNVWLGVSVENQDYANMRIPALMDTCAEVRFISYEPALGPITLNEIKSQLAKHSFETFDALYKKDSLNRGRERPGLNWVIIGGESGPGARRFNINWARTVIRQCKQADVAVFMKQVGAKPYACRTAADGTDHSGCIDEGLEDIHHSKGGEMSEWPDDLQVREFPERRIRNGMLRE